MYIPPKRLLKGSRVAIVSPASPVHPDRLMEGLDVIREAGLIPVLGPCVKNVKTVQHSSAPLADRIDELTWAFSAPEIAAVICTNGGEGSAALLPHLDYDLIRESRKPFLGRSDLSALSSGILMYSGLITISGQLPSIHLDKGENNRQLEVDSLFMTLRLMMSDAPWGSRPFSHSRVVPRTVSPGFARGIVVGGNVDTFTRLLGTPFAYDFKDKIVFIEDVHKGAIVLDREFLHMQLAGVMNEAAGFVIGEFCDSGKNEDDAIAGVIQRYFSNGVPCTFGYPFSHGPIVSPIPIGAMCEVDADTCEVSFDFSMG